MKLIYFILLISMTCKASEIQVYTDDDKYLDLQDSRVKRVLNCAFEDNGQFKINKIPAGRRNYFLDQEKKGIILPFYESPKKYSQYYFLGPLAYDEVLLLSKKPESLKTLGYIRSDMFFNLANKKYSLLNNFKDSYRVSSQKSLIRGFIEGRADTIVIRRIDLNDKILELKPKIQSLGFYSSQFAIHKTLVEFDKMVSKFKKCLQQISINIGKSEKLIMLNVILNNEKSFIKKEFFKQQIYKVDSGEIDKQWRKKDSEFKNKILLSSFSASLKVIKKSFPFIKETFLFNNLGQVTGMSDVTTDFDQSDEEKFAVVKENQNISLKNISNIEYDQSANIFNINITLPIYKNRVFHGGLHLVLDVNDLIHYTCEKEKKMCTFSP